MKIQLRFEQKEVEFEQSCTPVNAGLGNSRTSQFSWSCGSLSVLSSAAENETHTLPA